MSNSPQHPPISLGRRRAITAGLLLGMSLGALEATVVGTAMPTVIATLGGLEHYSWVFSAYLLTSTATVPIWGRLSDLYGRRRIYLIGFVFFLVGLACMAGAANSMALLIAARAVQGLGTGAIIPLSMTIVGELYTLAERARTQALFSGVWGLASIAGPLVGGYITDSLSWRWVFYLNLPFGLLAVLVIALAYPPIRPDAPGSGGLARRSVAVHRHQHAADRSRRRRWACGGLAGGAARASSRCSSLVERRAPEPILPIDLLRPRSWRDRSQWSFLSASRSLAPSRSFRSSFRW